MEKVFVYGTLREGFWNHCFLNGAEKIGKTWITTEKFAMGKWGPTGFPMACRKYVGMAKKFKPHEIVGELYAVNDEHMENLDRLENNGRLYQREEVEIFNPETGEYQDAWMYLYLRRLEGLENVKNGDWAASIPTE